MAANACVPPLSLAPNTFQWMSKFAFSWHNYLSAWLQVGKLQVGARSISQGVTVCFPVHRWRQQQLLFTLCGASKEKKRNSLQREKADGCVTVSDILSAPQIKMWHVEKRKCWLLCCCERTMNLRVDWGRCSFSVSWPWVQDFKGTTIKQMLKRRPCFYWKKTV